MKSHRGLGAAIDFIIQKIQQTGVLVRFQKFGPDPLPPKPPVSNGNNVNEGAEDLQQQQPLSDLTAFEAIGDSWKCQRVQLILKPNKTTSQGHWPIPEAYSVESVG